MSGQFDPNMPILEDEHDIHAGDCDVTVNYMHIFMR